jgi:hypothetical protein
MPKIGGIKLGTFDGITVYANPTPAKKTGKDRLWIHIRQEGGTKKWKVYQTLAYARALDIRFVDEP